MRHSEETTTWTIVESILLPLELSRLVLWPTHPPNWYRGLSPIAMRSGREADRSPLFSGEVEMSCTPTPPYAFIES